MKTFFSERKEETDNYISYLKTICSLFRLFTDSEITYLYYCVTENIFCKAFNAENLSKHDYNAKVNKIGIGLKTFISNIKIGTKAKIAEFDEKSSEIRGLANKSKFLAVQYIAKLRNERIDFANMKL